MQGRLWDYDCHETGGEREVVLWRLPSDRSSFRTSSEKWVIERKPSGQSF